MWKGSSRWVQQARAAMSNVHEFQAQKLMRTVGVAVADGEVVSTPSEVKDIVGRVAKSSLDGKVVVKAQVYSGGRGLGRFDHGYKSGVHICKPEEAEKITREMIGHRLITKQTGEQGLPVNKVYVVASHEPVRESYVAFLLDRSMGGPVIVGSAQGGTSIEEVAAKNPSAVFKIAVNSFDGLSDAIAEDAAKKLGFGGKPNVLEQAKKILQNLYKLFVNYDCTQVEVNPLIEDKQGNVLALDAKLNFDTNALFRHPEVAAMKDISQEDARDVAAEKYDLNYIGLDGNIGCLVNGAGLAMATMDIIKLYGGTPANFLDVGGGANENQVLEALRILNEDKHVRVILVNIFGGIMRCDIIAVGLVNAAAKLNMTKPLVVRLEGTNKEEALVILDKSRLKIVSALDLDDAAKKAVSMSQILSLAKDADLGVRFELPL